VVDDASHLADAVTAGLDPEFLDVIRVRASHTDGHALEGWCRQVEAVALVSDGWDAGAYAVIGSALDHLLVALRGSGKKLLYVSEATVIGDTGKSFGNEDSPRSSHAPHPWHCTAEATIMRAVTTGIRSVIIRPTLVHGNGAGSLVQGLIEHARLTMEAVYVGNGAAATSTVHVDDLAALVQSALRRAPEGSTYMAASEEVLTWKQIAQLVARASDPPAMVRSISPSEADLLGLDGSVMTTSCVVHDDGARRRLGWQPTRPALAEELTAAQRLPPRLPNDRNSRNTFRMSRKIDAASSGAVRMSFTRRSR
jgi:nucleoside-diphosphate-sugar epimerase